MEINITLPASPRTAVGKGAARRLRSQGLIPAVFYGRKIETKALSVNSKALATIMSSETGSHTLIRLVIGDEGSTEARTVILKDFQIHPVKRNLIHADFYEVTLDRPIETEVSIVLVGKPIGIEKGGLLQQVRREVLVGALPQNVPNQIEVDISHLDIGHSVHVDEIKPPSGVEIISDVNLTIATVVAPKGIKIAEEEEIEGEKTEIGTEGESE